MNPSEWPLAFRTWLWLAVNQHGKSTGARAWLQQIQMTHRRMAGEPVTIIHDRAGDCGYPGTPTTMAKLQGDLQAGRFPQEALLTGHVDPLQLARLASMIGPYAPGGVILAVDEIDLAMQGAGPHRQDDGFNRIIHYGAHRDTRVSLIGTVRRPVNLGVDLPALCEAMFIGRIQAPDDLDWIKRGWGGEARDAAQSMERFRFLLCDRYHAPTFLRVTQQPSIEIEGR